MKFNYTGIYISATQRKFIEYVGFFIISYLKGYDLDIKLFNESSCLIKKYIKTF